MFQIQVMKHTYILRPSPPPVLRPLSPSEQQLVEQWASLRFAGPSKSSQWFAAASPAVIDTVIYMEMEQVARQYRCHQAEQQRRRQAAFFTFLVRSFWVILLLAAAVALVWSCTR